MKASRKIQIVIVTGLLILLALFYAPHAIKKHRLKLYEQQLRARGEKLDIAELIPKTPAGSNGTYALLWAASQLPLIWDHAPPTMQMITSNRAMVAWAQPILSVEKATNVWMAVAQDVAVNGELLAQLCDALTNQVVHVDLVYIQGYALMLPHLSRFSGAARELSAITLFFLHEHEPDQAWVALMALSRFSKVWRGEPLLGSQKVRSAIAAVGVETVWEALQYHRWSDSQLAQLQHIWQSFSLTEELASTMAMERAMRRQTLTAMQNSRTQFFQPLSGMATFSDMLENFLEHGSAAFQDLQNAPSSWFWKWYWSYEDEQLCDRTWQIELDDYRHPPLRQSLTRWREAMAAARSTLEKQFPQHSRFLLSQDLLPMIEEFTSKILRAETQREMAVAAIALERFHLRHARWPTTLNELVPGILPALPRDFMDGEPLRYHLNPDGTFVLYSVGEDGIDDGGDPTPAKPANTVRWFNGLDWVWPQPATDAEVDAYQIQMRQRTEEIMKRLGARRTNGTGRPRPKN